MDAELRDAISNGFLVRCKANILVFYNLSSNILDNHQAWKAVTRLGRHAMRQVRGDERELGAFMQSNALVDETVPADHFVYMLRQKPCARR